MFKNCLKIASKFSDFPNFWNHVFLVKIPIFGSKSSNISSKFNFWTKIWLLAQCDVWNYANSTCIFVFGCQFLRIGVFFSSAWTLNILEIRHATNLSFGNPEKNFRQHFPCIFDFFNFFCADDLIQESIINIKRFICRKSLSRWLLASAWTGVLASHSSPLAWRVESLIFGMKPDLIDIGRSLKQL